jgi:hypothetical protein
MDQQAERFNQIAEQASAASDAMRRTLEALNSLDEKGRSELQDESLLRSVDAFERLAERASDRAVSLMSRKRGRPANLSFRFGVLGLAVAYKHFLGHWPTVTYSDATGEYGGVFVDFALPYLSLMASSLKLDADWPIGNQTRARAIARILKNRGRPPGKANISL